MPLLNACHLCVVFCCSPPAATTYPPLPAVASPWLTLLRLFPFICNIPLTDATTGFSGDEKDKKNGGQHENLADLSDDDKVSVALCRVC